MKENQEQCKILASLVVFRELYDKEKDIYGVLAEFLNEIIAHNHKHQFNLTEITNLLNSTYDFSIPEAVINTTLRRLNIKKDRGIFIVNTLPKRSESHLHVIQEKSLSNNDSIMKNLFTFIETEKRCVLSKDDKSKVIQSFYSFLLDDSFGNEYSEYISGFTISHKNDDFFYNNLNKIREGLILYTGIKYSNLGEIGSWKTNLKIFLDTEILFHFAGYNGELYKSLFEDFYNYVKEINNKAKKILIELKYFHEVKNEIDFYFAKAEEIVEGKEQYNIVKSTAMASIIEGCQTRSDVVSKKTDFYHLLKINLITETEEALEFQDENYKYNLINEQLLEKLSDFFGFDVLENLKFLNYINLLRKDKPSTNFENIGSILLTGNSITMKIAIDPEIKQEGVVPLATTLNWITNRFWFKLNKGFGDGKFPLSFDVIAKAQMVLSSILDKSVLNKYDELQAQFKTGQITEEQAKARIINLRAHTKKPEEIDSEDISSILDVINEDSIEQFIKEQEIIKLKAEAQKQENKKLKEELNQTRNALIMESSKRAKTQKDFLDTKVEQLDDKKEILERLEQNKTRIMKQVIKKYDSFKIRILIFSLIVLLITIVLFFLTKNEILDKIIIVIPILIYFLSFIYFLVFEKIWDWNPIKFMEKKKEYYTKSIFNENNFDTDFLDKIQTDIKHLEGEISELLQEEDKNKNS